MADVNDYTSGKILEDVKLTNYSINLAKVPVLGLLIRKILLKRIKKFDPRVINIEVAASLIQDCEKCAVGERVCRAINTDSGFTESIFLDELADGMTRVGKSQYIEKSEAIRILKKYPKNPLVLARVSNKYMEICRSAPKDCIFFNGKVQN
ncbi:MAG: hypothetical protein ACLPWD_07295 [Methanobacterium sp.]